jgi:hypothetical protein
MSAQYNGEYTPKDRDRISWERDRTRLETEAKLFMKEALNGALYELAMRRRACGSPQDTDQSYLIIKHIIGALCDSERREVVRDAVEAVSEDLSLSQAHAQSLSSLKQVASIESGSTEGGDVA